MKQKQTTEAKGFVMPPRLYEYWRFSDDVQEDGDSKRRQREMIARIRQETGAVLDSSEDFSDAGVSAFRGANLEVGGLGRFVARLEEGKIAPGSILAIEKLDRLSRMKVGLALQLFLRIIGNGVVIYTYHPWERFDLDRINEVGPLVAAICQMAEAHGSSSGKSWRLGEAWKERKRKARETGDPIGGQVPFWIVQGPEGYTLPEVNRRAIQTIHDLSQGGLGMGLIASRMNEMRDQFPPFGRSQYWNKSYVDKLLTCREVVGECQPQRVKEDGSKEPDGNPIPGYYPAAISEECWERTQRIRRRRQGKCGRRGKGEASIVTGLAFWAGCKRRAIQYSCYQKGKVYPYLWYHHRDAGDGKGQSIPMVPYETFENGLLDGIALVDAVDVCQEAAEQRKVGERIGELLAQLAEQDEVVAHYTREAASPGKTLSQRKIAESIAEQAAVEKEKIAAEANELKNRQVSGQAECWEELRSLVLTLKRKSTEEQTRLRQRIKGMLQAAVESIWVVVQPVSRRKRVIHLQVYTRWGTMVPLVILPSDPTGVVPWTLQGVDLREWNGVDPLS